MHEEWAYLVFWLNLFLSLFGYSGLSSKHPSNCLFTRTAGTNSVRTQTGCGAQGWRSRSTHVLLGSEWALAHGRIVMMTNSARQSAVATYNMQYFTEVASTGQHRDVLSGPIQRRHCLNLTSSGTGHMAEVL
ncbi:hypothetical protein MN608_04973 [Microdochium nivale]|nr:hypothetical protein MN608_04973 [Microdochium nivale]